MFEYTERLKLPLLIPNQSGKEITHNEALITIDNLLQNHVISKDLNTPPTDFKTGDMYIIAENATKEWLNKENQLAIFDNGWRFLEPINGMLFYVLSENCFYVYKNNWIKLETLIDFTKLQNTTIDNLQKDEVIKYNGTTFTNTREINLLKLYINDKLLIDENLNISIKNNEDLNNIITITNEDIDFKNNVKISGINIDEHIVNVVNTNAEGFAKADLSNLTEEGQNSIKNVVNENVLNKDIDNITQTGINNIQNYLMPDYSAEIIINTTSIYTCPCAVMMVSTPSAEENLQIKVNGLSIFKAGTYIADVNSITLFFKKNDILDFSGSTASIKLYPLIGGQNA